MGNYVSSTVVPPTPPPTNYSLSSTRRAKPKKVSYVSGRMIECSICVETFVDKNFPKITKKCGHANSVCISCINRHIDSTLNDKGDANANCPYGRCGQTLEHSDVKRVATKELFERFDTLSLRQTLQAMQEFRWCKNARCGSGQIHYERDDAPIMTCLACGKKSCYTHDVPWHVNQTCAEYEIFRKEQEAATEDYLQRETKPCPKCGVRITKNGGCNHMTCRIKRCGYEFCWLCMADYNEIRKNGNKKHMPTCQFYA